MSELRIVLGREFVERVRSRSFVLSTVLTPLFFGLVFVFPMLGERMAGGGESLHVAIVDQTAEGIGVSVALRIESGPEPRIRFPAVLHRPGPERVDSLLAAVRDRRLDGVLVIPADVVRESRAEYHAGGGAGVGERQEIAAALSEVVQGSRLREAGVDPEGLAVLLRPVEVSTTREEGAAQPADDGESEILLAIGIGLALYFVTLLYGMQVFQSVQEEKNQRIAEVLVSSVRTSDLMRGKVLGVGSAALLQVAVWAAALLLLVALRDRISASIPLPPTLVALMSTRAPLGTLLLTLGYAVLGFFLYASLFAAAGAAASSPDDAQRFNLPLVLPLFLPIMASDLLISHPDSVAARALSWVPFTAPIAMPMRLAAGGGHGWEGAGALLLLLATVYLLGSLAGKIYRVGILSTGKRPSLREIARWTRAA